MHRTKVHVLAVWAIMSLGLAACVAVTPVLTLEALKNAEYASEFSSKGKARLSDGRFEEAIAPGSATKLIITFTDWHAFGDLNGDGLSDAAVILVPNPGGSGTFYTLEAVVNDDGLPKPIASTLLGDRIKINAVTLQAGKVTVDMVTHGKNDPMCCPTQPVTQTYRLEGSHWLREN